jgi:AraC-like DNA-binding protein
VALHNKPIGHNEGAALMDIIRTMQLLHEHLDSLADVNVDAATKERITVRALTDGGAFFVQVARGEAKYPGIQLARDLDELVQIVRMQAWGIFKDIANGKERPGTFEQQLRTSSRSAIRDFADSSQNTMVARASTANRRARQEIAAKNLDDQIGPNPCLPASTILFGVPVEITDGHDAAGHVEMQSTIDRTIDTIARFESVALYSVAQMMLSWFPNGDQPSVADIARELHIPATTARRYCREVAGVFKHVHDLVD